MTRLTSDDDASSVQEKLLQPYILLFENQLALQRDLKAMPVSSGGIF